MTIGIALSGNIAVKAWLTDFPSSLIGTEQQISQYCNRYANSCNPAIKIDDNPAKFS